MLFSVITVCYNDLKGLKMTFESLIKQSFSDYEMIIVDGKSSDGTAQWLEELKNPQVSWISEPDNGIFDAMNKGLKMAKGDFTIFMNSYDEFAGDDVLKRTAVEIQKQKSLPGFIYGDSLDISPEGVELYKNARSYTQHYRGMFSVHQAMFFRNDNGILYPDRYRITADYAFIGLHLEKYKNEKILQLDFPVCKFKLGGTNETARYKALSEDFHIRRNILKISLFSSSLLFILHYIHTLLKRFVPGFTKHLRYNK